ncbi:MAG: hypothetical protein ACRC6V_12170 [Bacteroidales bacterium]
MDTLWCGEPRKPLTETEKRFLFHEHEAKRLRFFGDLKKSEYHASLARTIKYFN